MGGDSTPNTENARLSDATALFRLFTPERYTNLALCAAAFLILLVAVGMMMRSGTLFTKASLGLIFGSGGLITYSSNRLLRMWTDMVKIVFGSSDHAH